MSLTYAYRAQSFDGQPLTGTIDATDPDQARQRLEALRLRVTDLEPAGASPAVRPLRGDDFLTFNQQLAHLTAAGLPLEHGLRLIARDMRRGRVANTVKQIADELEKGTPLAQAFDKHATQFPSAYGSLIAAGVKTNNLSGMLLNLGEHLRTLGRLRAALWRALSYPAVVFLALCAVVAFICGYVLPQFRDIFGIWEKMATPVRRWGAPPTQLGLPWPTWFLLEYGQAIAVGALVLAVALILAILLWQFLRATGRDGAIRDKVILRIPLVGPVLRRSIVARWCDAVRLGVVGGMDLPAAMRTAGDAVGSGRLRRDAQILAARLESGHPVDSQEHLDLLPATVTAGIELSSQHGGLPQTLETLARMYQQQAHSRVAVIPAALTPLFLALLTFVIGFIVLAMFLPFVRFINALV
jgi:type IV pilus assembly protein PilC